MSAVCDYEVFCFLNIIFNLHCYGCTQKLLAPHSGRIKLRNVLVFALTLSLIREDGLMYRVASF